VLLKLCTPQASASFCPLHVETAVLTHRLLLVAGAWTLYYKEQQYMRLIDAQSREEAELQISEMLLIIKAVKSFPSGPTDDRE
jgi:hypothetical protein